MKRDSKIMTDAQDSKSDDGRSERTVIVDLPESDGHVEEVRLPKERMKTLAAFCIMQISFVINMTSLALTHDRVPGGESLPDFILGKFQPFEWALDVAEYLLIVNLVAAASVVVFHKHRYIVSRRIFLLLALLYIMRAVTMFVTVLPSPNIHYYCSPKEEEVTAAIIAKRVVILLSGVGLSFNGRHHYCGDYIFSGHTIIFVMSYLVVSEYTSKRCVILHLLSLLTSIVGVVMLFLSHGHYTVDIVIAYYLTTTLFWKYHTLADHEVLKNPRRKNSMRKMFWFILFTYLEKNVKGPVPCEYECPLPWPQHTLSCPKWLRNCLRLLNKESNRNR